jgi:hypothetical protein
MGRSVTTMPVMGRRVFWDMGDMGRDTPHPSLSGDAGFTTRGTVRHTCAQGGTWRWGMRGQRARNREGRGKCMRREGTGTG